MKNNIRALKSVSKTMLEDRLCSNSGLVKLLKTEIIQALSPYIEIDPTDSSFHVEITAGGVYIDCHIRAHNIKRFGLNVQYINFDKELF